MGMPACGTLGRHGKPKRHLANTEVCVVHGVVRCRTSTRRGTGNCPVDLLHLFPDGLLRSELAWLLFIFIKMGLKLDTLNASSRAYSGFPADVRIPPFTEKLKKGNPSNSNPNP